MLQIVYIHIPKTAGSSVLSLFREIFQNDEIVQVKRDLFNRKPETDPSRLLLDSIQPTTKVLHGHFTYNELQLVIDRYPNAKIITFLRQPVDRVLSNYTFFKKRILTGRVDPSQKHRVDESLLTYARLPQSRNRMHSFLDGLKLNDLYFIGFVENFENDVKALFQSLNLNIRNVPFINRNSIVTPSDLALTESEIAQLNKLNHKDHLLYRKAIKMKRLQS